MSSLQEALSPELPSYWLVKLNRTKEPCSTPEEGLAHLPGILTVAHETEDLRIWCKKGPGHQFKRNKLIRMAYPDIPIFGDGVIEFKVTDKPLEEYQ